MNLKRVFWRIKVLVTRKLELFPGYVTKEPWRTVWGIAGVQSYNWWWVRKWGKLPCGCTRNPLTRRMLLYTMECVEHFGTIERLRRHGDDQGPVV